MKRILAGAAFGAVLGMAFVAASTTDDASAFSGEKFEIVGGGTQTHFEAQPAPGKKAFVNKLSAAAVAAAIVGVNTDFNSQTYLEHDAGGKAYIFLDSLTSWRLSPHLDGSEATTLTGLVDGAGNFMFAGTHAKSSSQVVVTGKVKFAKGTYTPTGISGKVVGVSPVTRHFISGTFKSLGKAIP